MKNLKIFLSLLLFSFLGYNAYSQSNAKIGVFYEKESKGLTYFYKGINKALSKAKYTPTITLEKYEDASASAFTDYDVVIVLQIETHSLTSQIAEFIEKNLTSPKLLVVSFSSKKFKYPIENLPAGVDVITSASTDRDVVVPIINGVDAITSSSKRRSAGLALDTRIIPAITERLKI